MTTNNEDYNYYKDTNEGGRTAPRIYRQLKSEPNGKLEYSSGFGWGETSATKEHMELVDLQTAAVWAPELQKDDFKYFKHVPACACDGIELYREKNGVYQRVLHHNQWSESSYPYGGKFVSISLREARSLEPAMFPFYSGTSPRPAGTYMVVEASKMPTKKSWKEAKEEADRLAEDTNTTWLIVSLSVEDSVRPMHNWEKACKDMPDNERRVFYKGFEEAMKLHTVVT